MGPGGDWARQIPDIECPVWAALSYASVGKDDGQWGATFAAGHRASYLLRVSGIGEVPARQLVIIARDSHGHARIIGEHDPSGRVHPRQV